MNRPLFVAVALSTLVLAACGQKQEAAPPAVPAPAPAVAAPAPAPVAAPAAELAAPVPADAAKPADMTLPAPGEPKLQPK